jgi:hypothetical protein
MNCWAGGADGDGAACTLGAEGLPAGLDDPHAETLAASAAATDTSVEAHHATRLITGSPI